jgi:hypothetical protein
MFRQTIAAVDHGDKIGGPEALRKWRSGVDREGNFGDSRVGGGLLAKC